MPKRTANKRDWDAPAFDSAASDPQLMGEIDLFKRFSHLILQDSSLSFCDVGCGTGKFLDWLSKKESPDRYYGFDINKDMLAQARIKEGNFKAFKGDAGKNPFHQAFDVACSFFVLQWVSDPRAALRGIHESLINMGHALLLIPLRHKELWDAIEETVASEKWKEKFANYKNPRTFYSSEQYQNFITASHFNTLHFKTNIHHNPFEDQALKKFIASWLPHLHHINVDDNEPLLNDVVKCLKTKVKCEEGKIYVPFHTLEVVAAKPAVIHQHSFFSEPANKRRKSYVNDASLLGFANKPPARSTRSQMPKEVVEEIIATLGPK